MPDFPRATGEISPTPAPIPLPPEALPPHVVEAADLLQYMVSRAKRVGAVAMTVVTLAGTLSVPAERPQQQGAYEVLTERRRPALPKSPTEVCPPTKPKSIILADRLLASGEDPRFAEIQRREALKMPPLHKKSDAYQQARRVYKHELAADLGLHVFDIPDAAFLEKSLQQESSQGPHARLPELSFDDYLTRAKEFLGRYGVEIRAGTPGEKFSWHNISPTRAQLERTATKESLYNLMLYFAELPKEFVEFVGLTNIVLTATEANVPEGEIIAAGTARMGPNPDRRMTLNISDGVLQFPLFAHEVGGHMLDAGGCGFPGADNDPEFLALNHGETYDVKNRPPSTDTRGLDQQQALVRNIQDARLAGDLELANQLLRELRELRAKTTFVSKAGNLSEDKADTGGQISLPYPTALDKETPWTESKFILLFGRVTQYDPQLAIFLARYIRRNPHTFGTNPLVRQAMMASKIE